MILPPALSRGPNQAHTHILRELGIATVTLSMHVVYQPYNAKSRFNHSSQPGRIFGSLRYVTTKVMSIR